MGVVLLVGVDGSHVGALEFIRSYYMALGGMWMIPLRYIL
jgi:hypothetical protein